MDFNQFQNNDSNNDNKDTLNQLDNNIDIKVSQRNGRKCITTIHGLHFDKVILKNYAKDLRKLLGCSCSIDKDEQDEVYLKLSGKDTTKICQYLIEKLDIKKENIIVHGIQG